MYELRDRTMVHSMINEQNRQLSVMEYYLFPNHYIEELNPKPDGIKVYGAENGHFYELEITPLARRPSLDWLLSFGIQERVSECYRQTGVNPSKYVGWVSTGNW